MHRLLELKATSRFVRDYDRASPLLRACSHHALLDLRRRVEHEPKTALSHYTQVKGLKPPVREIPIAGGERMLAHQGEDAIYLLAIGDHEIVGHYQATGRVSSEISRCKTLPARIAEVIESGFFPSDQEDVWREYANEADPQQWLYYLDKQQSEVVEQIASRAISKTSPRDWYFSLVAGGPGTGKTSVLLALADRLPGLTPQFVIEDHVAKFIKASIGLDLDEFRCEIWDAEDKSLGGILLVDDPSSTQDIERARWLAQSRKFRAVVVGVDPYQLTSGCDDKEFSSLASGKGSELFELHACYRQKHNVGLATKRALESIAASSPFFVDWKKRDFAAARKKLTALVNSLEFPNPSGRFKKHLHPQPSLVEEECKRLAQAPKLWRHWPPYLVAWDREGLGRLPRGWRDRLRELPAPHRLIALDDALSVKGIEFQHAVLILSEGLFAQIESGFEGSTRRVYEQRRLLRIPISRAKDSVTVFVYPSAAS